jgi:hypothetical protein
MEKSMFKKAGALVLASVLCMVLLAGCTGQKLSADFVEADVKTAAENVISLINNKDSDDLLALCTVKMKDALTDDVLDKIYEAIGEGGQFKSIEAVSIGGQTDKASDEEFAVAVVKAKYEIKTFTFTISFTKQMKLTGLYYR